MIRKSGKGKEMMRFRLVLVFLAVTVFVPAFPPFVKGDTGGLDSQDVAVAELKAQIERMEQMLKAQQRQIDELKGALEGKEVKQYVTSPQSPPSQGGEVLGGADRLPSSQSGDALEDERIEVAVERYLAKEAARTNKFVHGTQSNLNMGYKKGFYLETLDRKFRLGMTGRLQFRYEYLDRDEGEDTSSFLLRRARLVLAGHTFGPKIKYKLEAGFDKGKDFHILDYYFNMTHIPAVNIQFGQFKAPFNRQRMTSSGRLQLIDRSEANEVFTLDRHIGLMLHSKLLDKKFEYGFGIFNGSSVDDRHASSGKNKKENDNNEHLFVLRAAYNPFGEFGYSEGDLEYSETLKATIAGAGAFSSDEIDVAGGTEDVDTTRLVGEVGLKYRGASFLSEIFYRHRDASDIGTGLLRGSIEDKGFFTQAGYFIIPKRLELAGRFSLVDYDDVSFDDLDEVREYTGGLNYFFEGHRSKLQANVVKVEEDVRDAKDEDSYKLQLQYQIYF